MRRLLAASPLPLAGKELTELAARKRTYVLRTVYASALFVTFAFIYANFVSGTRFGPRGRELLGTGRRIFDVLVGIQLVAIHVLLPATLAGAISEERERDSLQLLLLTRLSAGQIVTQKLIGRLVPMFTLVLLSLPLFALAYSFGGIGKRDIWLASFWLVLNGLYIGTFALMVSCAFRSTAAALGAAYLLGLPVLLAVLPRLGAALARGLAELGERLHSASVHDFAVAVLTATRPPHEVYWTQRTTAGWAPWLYGLWPLAMSALFLALGCLLVKRRGSDRSGSAALNFQRNLDRALTELNALVGGIVLFRERESLPGTEPVLWRERSKRALGRPQYFVRALLAIELPTVAIGLIVLVQSRILSGRIDWTGIAYMTLFFWIVASLAVIVAAVHLIPNERSHRTLDVLLTTPLSGREILDQKIRGLRRLKVLLAVPFLTVVLMRAFVDADSAGSGGAALLHVLISLLTFLLYMELFSWLALWVGMVVRNRSRAVLTAVIGLALWCVLPLGLGFGSFLDLLSPASLIGLSETPAACYSDMFPLAAIANSVLYTALWLVARRFCLARADRWLGRPALLAASAFRRTSPGRPLDT